MASFEVLHTQNHSSGSFPSEEYSLLPEVSAGVVPNGDINLHINDNFDLRNMHSALSAANPDSSVEVHSQLLDLIEENNSLKEKLNKNNSMMKEQMSTISAWREHMILSRDQQQQSLQEAKERISAIEKENAELREKIDSMEKMSPKEITVQSCEKCSVFDLALNNMLALDAMEDGESLLCELCYFREDLLQNLKSLCRHLETLCSTNINEEDKKVLKTFILLLKFKIASIEGGNMSATAQTDEDTSYEMVYKRSQDPYLIPQLRLDIEDLTKKLNGRDSELQSLREENADLCEKLKAYEVKLQEWEMALKNQFEKMNSKLEHETSISEKYKERCECLEQQIEEYQAKLEKTHVSDDHVVKELREEVQNLQDILKIEQRSSQSEKEKLANTMLALEKLQVEYDRVSKLLEVQSKDEREKNKELASLRESEAKEHLEKVDQLTAQLFEMEEQLRDCNAELRQLREEQESIPILKTQVEVYKTDFHNMESAKNAACDEVDRLKNELKKYERKCDSCPCSCNKSQASRGYRSGRFSEHDDQTNEVECPVCHIKFKNEREAQRHFYRSHEQQPE